MSPKTVKNIEAGAVFVGVIAFFIFVPERYFLALGLSMVAISVAGVYGIRKYNERLEERAKALEAADEPGEATTLRVRQRMLVEAGVLLAIAGLTAFIALMVE